MGAISATIGVVFPSLVIIYLIALYFNSILEIKFISNAFQGIKIAVGILIFDAGLRMIKKLEHKSILSYFIFISSILIMLSINIFSVKISTVVVMLAFGLLNLIIFLFTKQKYKDFSNSDNKLIDGEKTFNSTGDSK